MSDRQQGAGWWLASDGRWYPPESHPSVRPEASVFYAGFWLRVVAWLIDGFILGFGVSVVTRLFGVEGGGLFSTDPNPGATLIGFVVGWLYFALMESSPNQATLGKMALGLKVTDLAGNRITFGRATGRHFGKIVSAITLGIGFLMAGWTAKKQALHDMLADTLVVRAPARR